MYTLINGKETAAAIRKEMKAEVEKRVNEGFRPPHLAAVLLGNDGGSVTYVRSKEKACQEIGFKSTILHYPDGLSEEQLLTKIEELNTDPEIDGFIVQLPLPGNIDENKIIEAISPARDVDGFHPVNLGRLVNGIPGFVSATPAGIMTLLERYQIETEGKHVVVVGRSNIVGRPLSILLSQKKANATVTVCHSRTQNLKELCLQADILVAALGSPGFIKADMVKEGAVVIDVGTTRLPSEKTKSGYKLHGDVLFDEVAEKTSAITPVPGGVGPMTIVSLMINTLKAAKGEYHYS